LTVEKQHKDDEQEGTNRLHELAKELLAGKEYEFPKERKRATNSGSSRKRAAGNNSNSNNYSASDNGNGKAL
jgi:hypothetical protein